ADGFPQDIDVPLEVRTVPLAPIPRLTHDVPLKVSTSPAAISASETVSLLFNCCWILPDSPVENPSSVAVTPDATGMRLELLTRARLAVIAPALSIPPESLLITSRHDEPMASWLRWIAAVVLIWASSMLSGV